MARWAPQRADVIDEIAGEVLARSRGRAVVAIDGRDGAGKTTFADDLARAIEARGREAVRASADDFHRPRAERYARGRHSPQGCYLDSYDDDALRDRLVRPFRRAEPFVVGTLNASTDEPWPVEPREAGESAVLVVDGVFLHRGGLRDLWSYSVWLTAPEHVATARWTARDGVDPDDPIVDRHRGAHDLYLADADPSAAATTIVDTTDPEHPRRVFADSC